MAETQKPATTSSTSNKNLHAIILAVVGIIVFIAGLLVATVRGTGLRGSGLGTVLIVIGVVMLLIAILRFYYKRK